MSRAADALADTMVLHGVDRVFCVPGESYLALLDALHDRDEVQVVACRHEGGAGFMAVADAKLTGAPAVLMVSRGPGAGNAAIAVHTAEQDAVPLVLLIGQVPRVNLGRGAFQEVDYQRTFGDMAKWIKEIHEPRDLAKCFAQAMQVAQEGTPGPVVLVLPEDMLRDPAEGIGVAPLPLERIRASDEDLGRVAEMLAAARRPLLIAGGGTRRPSARKALFTCSEAWSLPVATSFKNQDVYPNDYSNYAGHLGYGVPAELRDTLQRADLIIAVGTRLGDVTTQGYQLPSAPQPLQPLIHVYPDANHLDRVFFTTVPVCGEAEDFLDRLAVRAEGAVPAMPDERRQEWLGSCHAVPARMAEWTPAAAPDGVDFGHVVAAFMERLGDDAVVTMDAGNFNTWVHRYFRFKPTQTLLGAVSGAMGMGVPAGIAAALRHPDRQVVTVVGDGGALMTGSELATAVRHGAKIRVFVSNNASYGTIRLHQERAFPGRCTATDLVNPDFAKWAESFGAKGLSVRRPEDALPALDEALAHDGPVVVDVAASLQHITAFTDMPDADPV